MSRGPGRVMRELRAIFEAEPNKRFTVAALATRIYGDTTPSHCVCIRDSLRKLTPDMGLSVTRAGDYQNSKGGRCQWVQRWMKPS